MLRRDIELPDSVPGWLLVTQKDHAFLSRDLALAWGGAGFESLGLRDQLLAAVTHHDDGWKEADALPTVDPNSGRPRDFLEMPLELALSIWERSMLASRQFGPLAGYLVTRHFQALLERHPHASRQAAEIAASLLGPDGPWQGWFAEWQAEDPNHNTLEKAEHWLKFLQLFDWLSLWLGMAVRQEPLVQPTPDGPTVTFTPCAPGVLTVNPWPFREESVTVALAGRPLPQPVYADSAAVLAALGEPITLTWRFERALPPIDVDRLGAESFLKHVEHLPVLTSTNDHARKWAQEGSVPCPALIVADHQTAGRGRGANRWWTGRGSLACTLLVDPTAWQIAPADGPLVSLAVAVALVETLSSYVDDVGLHWPNDIFVNERKIAGVLIERLVDGRLIIGIGLNVNNTLADAPAELRAIATTLRDLTDRQHDRTEVLMQMLRHLDTALTELGRSPESLVENADGMCLQHGRLLTLDTGREQVTGVCLGLAEDGAIVIHTPAGPRRFLGGVLRHAESVKE